ncbi:hypothetical protein E7T06_05125 [Deinococcus sp. Arct2-2]|uniref:VOC family protein n=1 Tax=Deinococcus sp. Arct2-2 TaxID=2568653 RepID=UPI0010A34C7D|nr:VOC family protein [Deinococcus sp. Arct2-2]THF70941.1 hypothetical protein E7T06_05125 [Deinococcus sp. Arct2-2]
MIDHVSMFIEPDGPEIARMEAAGLVETYRRSHPGQGTRNVCYCFDNLFLELLWVDEPDAARSATIARTRLYERSLWRTNGACPFGIAWRRPSLHPALTVPTWTFTPPYLPDGMSIPVATDSDDVRQPMMFESPGAAAPIEWPPEKRGSLQHDAGFGVVREILLMMPPESPPSAALQAIGARCVPHLRLGQSSMYAMHIRVASLNQKPDLMLSFPLQASTD